MGAVLLALLGIAAVSKYLSDRSPSDRLVLSGTIEADEIHVGSKVSGRIEAVLVKEGQEVTQGDTIIRFERYDLDAKHSDAVAAVAAAESNLEKTLHWFRPEELEQAKAQAEAAWMNYEQARNGPRKQEIDAARAELEAANADVEVTKATLARIERLVGSGIESRQGYDEAKAAYDRAIGRRDSTQKKLEELLAGTRWEEVARAEREYKRAAANLKLVERGARKEDIDSARSQLERARAALQQIETQLNELEVKAPADAFVEVLQVRPGDLINPNSPVATLIEVDRLWVRVYVPETELVYARAALGKEISVSVDTFRGETFHGRIEEISSRGEFTPRNVQTREERTHQVFGVRIRLDNAGRKLGGGMAAEVTIPK
ncbi:MAG TPA: efflux RND transporter periplasmic adaptor subunit [Blastocatellia bacterium]|nr:efflux RND transporter periplasmic adaptor subunit [Blastocatellia bacterium]